MDRPVEVTAGGVRWLVLPECRESLLGPDGLRLDEWLRSGQAEVVKHGPHRTVYRVALPGLAVYVKHYRLMDVRAWLRELIRPAKALLEYRQALAVAARRVPTVVPVAVGRQQGRAGPTDSFLITRSLDGTEALSTFLETRLPDLPPPRQARLRQRVAVALARFIARLHASGIAHHDLHAGNLLIDLATDDQVRLYVIDLHATRLGGPLSARARRANLIILNRYFSMRASRSDRLRFWRAYVQARHSARSAADRARTLAQARRLEEMTWASNLHFWRQRDARCLGSNRHYQIVRSPIAAGHAVRDLDSAFLDTLLADPDAPLRRPDARILKDSRSSTVVEFALNLDGMVRPVIYKRFRSTGLLDPLLALARPTGALRSWVNGHGLRERDLPTARPLAVLHRWQRGLPGDGYLLMEKVPDAVSLYHFAAALQDISADGRRTRLRPCIDRLARVIRELHRRNLSHRDLKATNILVQSLRLWLIDLVGVRRYRELPESRRIQNLARLHVSFHATAMVTRTDKLRFLRTYLNWGLLGKNDWKRWWREIEQATQDKVARNRRNRRPLG